jgi:hypothetical protein
VLLVLAILFSVPFFNYQNWLTEPSIHSYEVQLLAKMEPNSTSFNLVMNTVINQRSQTHYPVLYIS